MNSALSCCLVLPGPKETGSTRVLVWIGLLWYCYAIVTGEVRGQDGAVWARFVLVTSLLLFVRFSTLLTRHSRRIPSEKRAG
jgi:hypothetical protein